ncbi:hypothetical protein F5X99DRAFT_408008 [Biscogniauxia marginata]|nr:hypothetical protein F5X99DRAFT_408008 [Biscogniauxia marginata]
MAYTPVHDHSFNTGTTFSLAAGDDRYAYHNALRQEHVERQPFSAGDDRPKEFADVEFHGVNPYWTTISTGAAAAAVALPGVPSGPSHQRGWSDSTIAAMDGGNRGVDSDSEASKPPRSPPQKNNKKRTCGTTATEESWTLEVAGVVVALAAVGSILGVLARFNGRALPEWPYYITLNALIALLVTVATAAMGISLQSGLSQLKWIRFKEGRAPLADMERFDEASRGTWGAVKLLATARGGYLGSFGAIIAITALALSPFAQQVVTYQTRIVESPVGASVNRALNYTGALPGNTSSTGFVPILPLKSAVYNGLFAENGRPGAALAFECQTGNCTWDTYETLAVCASCVDLTPFIEPYCGGTNSTPTTANNDDDSNDSSCGWQVPQGARLDTGSEVFSITPQIPHARGDQPHSTIAKLLFMGAESRSGPAGSVQPWARQCALSACVQTLETRVANGALGERVLAEAVNQTVVDISDADGGQDRNVYNVIVGNDTAATTTTTTYMLGIEAMLAMRGWFSTLFATGAAVRSGAAFNRTVTGDGSNSQAVVVNLTVGISSGTTFFDSDVVTAFYWNYYEYDGGLDMLVRDVATSMTVAFRGFLGAEPVGGRAAAAESYVHVRWGFAALPIVVVVGAALFLAAAVWRTRRSRTRPWKSSALAMLLHGLDDEVRARLVLGDSLGEQKRRAKGVKVQLDESDGINGSLLRG